MVWIKRNIGFVIGVVVTLALLGGAGFFLHINFKKQTERVAALITATNEFKSLIAARPYPSANNIATTVSNTVVIGEFVKSAEKVFVSQPQERMAARTFKIHLINSLEELRKEAVAAQVKLPPNYKFTFGELVPMPNLLPYSIEPLSMRLAEVQEICATLFESRIHALDGIQRVPAYRGDPATSSFLTDLMVRTNLTTTNGVIISTPYRFTFRGFSTELAEVMNRFAKKPGFWAVRKLDVSTVGAQQIQNRQAPMGMLDPSMLMEAGLDPSQLLRGQMAPAVARPAAGGRPATRSPFTTVLNEKPLQVTMILDVVKLLPLAHPK